MSFTGGGGGGGGGVLISGEMEIGPVSSLPLETFSSNKSCGNRFKVTWNVLQDAENRF